MLIAPKHVCAPSIMHLTAEDTPAVGSPELAGYQQMQKETTSLNALMLWLSVVYPQCLMPVVRCCRLMSNPPWSANRALKMCLMHLVAFPCGIRYGGPGCTSLLTSVPPIAPHTPGRKEYGFTTSRDANLEEKSMTGIRHSLAGGSIDVVVQRQHTKTVDIHHAEINADAHNILRALPTRNLLHELRITQAKTPDFGDSQSCQNIARDAASMRRSAWVLRKAGVIQETYDEELFDNVHVAGVDNNSDGDTKYITYEYYKKHTEHNNNMLLVKKELASMLAPSDHGPTDEPCVTARTITGNAVVDLELSSDSAAAHT